MTCIVAVQS